MAMVDGQRLYDLNIELPASERTKANIYKGTITRIEPSLEAAFVDYGADRHGFLPLKDISSEYFIRSVEAGTKTNIKDVLKEGQDIVVQVDKEERGNKGAALTTFVSLAGRFIVLKPNKSRSGGVSRRIVGADRDLARESLDEIEIPKDMSVILRTAGIDRSVEELAWDLENLLTVWQAILNVVLEKPSPFLIYRESDAVVRALRDYLTNEIGEILIDDENTYKDALEFVGQVMPHNLGKLKHYSDPVPLFTRYQIESQIESAFSHSVSLPSGGSIVIDHTEALVSIDINSARATKGGDIEATALNTNSEAAAEIGRQLRLRDLGGLIVIDFIDMGPQKNQREIESRLRESVRQDRARVQLGKISRFGLLEMSRQRLRPSLGESSYHTCPRCSGIGTIRSVESLALTILRIIGEEAGKERTAKVIAQLPVEVATYLLNEKRDWVQGLESRNNTQVILIANASLETPHFQVRRVRDDQIEFPENTGASYALADTDEEPELPPAMQDKKVAESAAVATMKPATSAPARKPSGKGFWATLIGFFSAGDDKPKKKKPASRQRRKPSKQDGRKSDGQRRRKKRETSKQSGDGRDSGRKKTNKPARKKPAAQNKSRKVKSDAQQPGKANEAVAGKQDNAQGDSTKPSRSRRSRGGRQRRRGGERTDQKEAANSSAKVESSDSEAQSGAQATPKPASRAGGNARSRQGKTARADVVPTPADNGSPKARTDAEGTTDSKPKTKSDAAAAQQPQPAPAPKTGTTKEAAHPAAVKSADKSAPEPKPVTARPEGRLLPWEPATPAPANKASERSADKPAPAPKAAEPVAAKPVEKPAPAVPKPAEPVAAKPVEKPAPAAPKPAESVAAKSVEKPAPAAPKPAQPIAAKPVEKPAPAVPKPAAPVAAKPVEKPAPVAPKPAQPIAAKPVEKPAPAVPKPAEPVAAKPVEKPAPAAPKPAEPVTAKPVEKPVPAAPKPAQPVAVKPVEKTVPAAPKPAQPVAVKTVEKPVPAAPKPAQPVAVKTVEKTVPAAPKPAQPVVAKPVEKPAPALSRPVENKKPEASSDD